jgi:hypothetical protein
MMSETHELRLREARVIEAMTALTTTSESNPKVTVTEIEYDGAHVVRGRVKGFALRTWLGAPGYTWEVWERGASGRRTRYTWWLAKAVGQDTEWEAGTLTARTVTGNANRGTYEVIMGTQEVTVEGLDLS